MEALGTFRYTREAEDFEMKKTLMCTLTTLATIDPAAVTVQSPDQPKKVAHFFKLTLLLVTCGPDPICPQGPQAPAVVCCTERQGWTRVERGAVRGATATGRPVKVLHWELCQKVHLISIAHFLHCWHVPAGPLLLMPDGPSQHRGVHDLPGQHQDTAARGVVHEA